MLTLASTAAFAAGPLAANAAAASGTTSAGATAPLLFGVYPGGSAGGASGANPDNVSKDLAAVKELDSSGAPFMVHLYAEYYGPGSYSASAEVGAEVRTFASAGIKVELVECYRPTDGNPGADVPGFISWVDATLKALGPDLAYVQITNEANESGDPSSNDGAYAGAQTALVEGVEAAKSYITARDEPIKVGFNWSYDSSAAATQFWTQLRTLGGATFANDLDWVGVDVYPGTWQSIPADADSFGDGVSEVMDQAVADTRNTDMPLAGIPLSVPIQITETGYPTGPERTAADQEAALAAEVNAVNGLRTTDNVSALEFFDLRDAITNSTAFEDQYGLMTDQWAPKPAFTEYQSLIAQLGGKAPSTASAASAATTHVHHTARRHHGRTSGKRRRSEQRRA